MHYTRALVTVLVALTTCVAGIEAQSSSHTLDPLSLPVGQMLMCQSLPVTPDDSADVVLQFTDRGESLGGRETTIAYDGNGTPLSLIVNTDGSTGAGQGVLHIVIIRFEPTADGVHGILDGKRVGSTTPDVQDVDIEKSLPPGWNKTPADEITRARNLALDFWKRRCSKRVESGMRPALPDINSIHTV